MMMRAFSAEHCVPSFRHHTQNYSYIPALCKMLYIYLCSALLYMCGSAFS